MSKENNSIPVYSLQTFSHAEKAQRHFQVEVFDANRHFQVSYPHRHDFFEVLFILKGSGNHVIDSSVYKIEPPCIFFMSPGQAHKLDLSTDVEGYIFIFTSDFYLFDINDQNKLLEFPFFFTIKQVNPPLIINNQENITFVELLFKQAIKEQEKEKYNAGYLRSLLDTILSFAATKYKEGDAKIKKGKGHLMVKRFYQLVEDNYCKNLSVNEYANMLAVTPNHLTQTVKQLTGKTSNEVLQSKQILEIKRLLAHTSLTVTQIADQLNFNDQSYFTKFFKKATGQTPGEFRSAMA